MPMAMRLCHAPLAAHAHHERKQIWNLQHADIRAVIHTISALTGKNFVIDPNVQGHITIVSKQAMTVDELYQVFLSMLQTLNYSAIPAGNVIKIVPSSDAKQYAGQIASSKRPGVGDQVVLRVVPVYNVSATQLVPILRPLMQNWSTIMAYTPSNSLIISGAASNVKRLVGIIHKMDRDNASSVAFVALKNANASDLVKVLSKLQMADRSEGKVTNVAYAANEQNNSILVSGSKVNIAQARLLIHRLDGKGASGMGNIEVVHLKYLQAKEMVPILTRLAHGQVAPGAQTTSSTNGSSSTSSSSSSVNTTSPLVASGGNSDVAIVAEQASNSVMISAPASTMIGLNKVINKLDVRPRQVLVEAIIVNVSESLVNKLGIQWGTFGSALTNGSSSDTSSAASALSTFQQGVGFLRNESITGLLTAIKTNADTDILATPSIVVLNNKKAVISDGKNVAIPNRSYAASDTDGDGSTTPSGVEQPYTTVERKNVSLTLNVTPQISPNHSVLLSIKQTNDQLEATTTTVAGSAGNPVIDTSEINTQVLVDSGDVLVLGGLIKSDESGTVTKVPILGDIPIIGKIFTYNNKTREKKNLLVFLKPVILNNRVQDRFATMKRYNYVRGEQIKKAIGQPLLSGHGPVLPGMKHQQRVSIPVPFSH